MKVLLACMDFPPSVGGIQTMLAGLARELKPWELTVVAPAASGADPFDRSQPYRIVRPPWRHEDNSTRRRLWGLAGRVIDEVRVQRPDILLCGHALLSPLAAALRLAVGVPYFLFTYDVEVRNRYLRPLLPLIFARAERVITISRYSTRLTRAAGCPEERIAPLPLGFDPHRFAGVPPSSIAAELGLAGRPWLLTVCRLEARYKGVDTVLRALPMIAARVPEVRYVVAGDGRLRGELEQMAESIGCRARVHFVGRVGEPDLAALYAHCTAFVLMSRDRMADGGAEGFGLVFLEANSFGKPVLGGNSGGIPDAVLDGKTGFLVDPEDTAQVALQAIQLLTDNALAARLGQQGRERVVRELTWRASAQHLQQLVEGALGTGA